MASELLGERLPVVLVTLGVIGAALTWIMWWTPDVLHRPGGWATPGDLWSTVLASEQVVRIHLGSVYTAQTALVTFPGILVLLSPVAGLLIWARIPLGPPVTAVSYTTATPIVVPYEIVLAASALWACDEVARRLGVSRPRRAVLAVAEGIALWNVTVRWGHPEDCVALACLLFAMLARADGATMRSAWWAGAAICLQPLALLALPVLTASLRRRQLAPFLVRAALPSAVLLAAPLTAAFHSTMRALLDQPNYPLVDHPTPWLAFAPNLGDHVVAAGPQRIAALALAVTLAIPARRAWRTRRVEAHAGATPAPRRESDPVADLRRSPAVSAPALATTVWWTACALSLRDMFESVMVAYYVWPVLALTLVLASTSRRRLATTSLLVVALTCWSDTSFRSEWGWWLPLVFGVGELLMVCRPRHADHETTAPDTSETDAGGRNDAAEHEADGTPRPRSATAVAGARSP